MVKHLSLRWYAWVFFSECLLRTELSLWANSLVSLWEDAVFSELYYLKNVWLKKWEFQKLILKNKKKNTQKEKCKLPKEICWETWWVIFRPGRCSNYFKLLGSSTCTLNRNPILHHRIRKSYFLAKKQFILFFISHLIMLNEDFFRNQSFISFLVSNTEDECRGKVFFSIWKLKLTL